MRDVKRTACPFCGSRDLRDRSRVGQGSPLYCCFCGACECAICWGWHVDIEHVRTCGSSKGEVIRSDDQPDNLALGFIGKNPA